MAEKLLELARRHIAESELVLADQEAKLVDLRTQGFDTSELERAIAVCRKNLEAMRAHLAQADSINRPPRASGETPTD